MIDRIVKLARQCGFKETENLRTHLCKIVSSGRFEVKIWLMNEGWLGLGDDGEFYLELQAGSNVLARKCIDKKKVKTEEDFRQCLTDLCDRWLENVGAIAADIARFKMTGM